MVRPVGSPSVTMADSPDHPMHLDLERAVLGVVLAGVHTVAVQIVRQHVPHPWMFAAHPHQLIWQACVDLDSDGVIPDAPAVVDLLSRVQFPAARERIRRGEFVVFGDEPDDRHGDQAGRGSGVAITSALAAVGGPQAIYALAEGHGAFVNLERMSLLLRDDDLKRRLCARLAAITAAATSTVTFAELLMQTDAAMQGLRRYGSSTTLHGLSDVLRETIAEISEHREQEQLRRSGCEAADAIVLHPGLYVIGARPGAGKTSFALWLARQVATAPTPKRVVYVSLDVARRDLVRKMMAAEARTPFRDLDMGTLTEPMQRSVDEAAKVIGAWPVDIVDAAYLTVHEIRATVRRRALECVDGIGLVVVDYLQLVAAAAPDQADDELTLEIVQTLKRLAMECRVPVLAMSQMTKTDGAPREPEIADLPCSRAIASEADAILFLHCVGRGTNAEAEIGREVELRVARHHRGRTGVVALRFNPELMTFVA
jgi:replicative DNA helicase